MLLLLTERREFVAMLEIVCERARQNSATHGQNIIGRIVQQRRRDFAALETAEPLEAVEIIVLRSVKTRASLEAAISIRAAEVIVIGHLRMMAHARGENPRRHRQRVRRGGHRMVLLGGVGE